MAVATGTLAAIGAGLGAGAGIFGSVQQGKTDKRNFQAQQAYQQYLQQMGQGMMQQGANPFTQQMQQFLGGMQPFQPQQGFTFDPTMLGGAPQIDPSQFQLGGQAPIDFQSIGSLPQLTAGQVGAPTGEQFNAGQDALMQMLRRQFNPVQDQNLQNNLSDLYGGASFDPNGVLSTLAPIDSRLIDEQVAGLRGGAGSLGQRFGSDLMQNERQLRENALQDIGARNAQITQSMFESGQNRRLQALGMGLQQNQFLSQFPLLAGQLQMQAAGQLQTGGLDFARLAQQAQIANQGAGLQAGQFNIGNALQAMMANQQAGMQTGQFNAQLAQQLGLANQGSTLQALLANQGLAGQFAMANQQAANQGGQFNAGQLQNMGQFNFGAGMQQNQMTMQGLMAAAQMQQAQNQNNLGIFGALAGVGVPQQAGPTWPGVVSDASQYLMLPWLLQQTRAPGR